MSQYRIKKKSRKTRTKYRKKQSIRKSPVFRMVVLSVILGLSLAYLLLFSPLLAIREIKITSPSALNDISPAVDNLVRAELKRRVAAIPVGKSFFLLNTNSIAKKIMAMDPAIETALVKKTLSHTISIELKEHTPRAVWCCSQNNACYLIDGKGVVFEETIDKNFPVILTDTAPPGQMPFEAIGRDEMAQILEIFTFFSEYLKINVQYAAADTREKLVLKTQEGWEAYFSLDGDIATTLTKLGLLIEKNLPQDKRQNLQYIDLRFSKAYYK
ncbi:MAG: FtsQ-type POTRA domain-containing protein [Candidatus Pacebacteria bacterium]|nr:FtsQ-type POTRA domain-containing protein [Candidatus Paceibacterota bacterium]